MQETWVRSLGQEDPLEKQMATHSSVLTWEIPWTEEPSQRVKHDLATEHAHTVVKNLRLLHYRQVLYHRVCVLSRFSRV